MGVSVSGICGLFAPFHVGVDSKQEKEHATIHLHDTGDPIAQIILQIQISATLLLVL